MRAQPVCERPVHARLYPEAIVATTLAEKEMSKPIGRAKGKRKTAEEAAG